MQFKRQLQSYETQRIGETTEVAGCFLKREGASHSLWINPRTGVIEAIPGHTEIKEPLARKILRSLDAE